jgi:hypothetical protein
VARALLPAPPFVGEVEVFCGEGDEMDFQVHEQTYFLSLAEDEKQWLVFVDTPTGARPIPVYVDATELRSSILVREEKQRIPN